MTNGKPNPKIDAAIEKATKPPPVIERRTYPTLPLAQILPGQPMKLIVKPADAPHLLVWIPELNAYQPCELPIGTTYVLAEYRAGTRPALWQPGQPT